MPGCSTPLSVTRKLVASGGTTSRENVTVIELERWTFGVPFAGVVTVTVGLTALASPPGTSGGASLGHRVEAGALFNLHTPSAVEQV